MRHGETSWNAEHRVQGQLDIPLNDVGMKQAEAVGKALKGESFDVIYSSDLARTRQTAGPSANFLSLKINLEKDLRERHYGIFERLTYAEVKVKRAAEYARFAARDPEFDFVSGESLLEFSRRSIAALSRIAGAHAGQHVLIFTHGGVLDELYRHINDVPMSAVREFGIPNCGLNRVEFELSKWQIRAWADIAHLEGALDDF
ncbi:MAG: histidine phosphatase family protein [Burkholderiales bacterium]